MRAVLNVPKCNVSFNKSNLLLCELVQGHEGRHRFLTFERTNQPAPSWQAKNERKPEQNGEALGGAGSSNQSGEGERSKLSNAGGEVQRQLRPDSSHLPQEKLGVDEIDHKLVQSVRMSNGDWRTKCSCGVSWTQAASRSEDYLNSIFDSHVAYAKRVATRVD